MLQKTDLLTSRTQFLWQSQCEFQCHHIRFNNIILSLMKNPNLGSAGRRISSTGHRGKLYLYFAILPRPYAHLFSTTGQSRSRLRSPGLSDPDPDSGKLDAPPFYIEGIC